jgi:hypothetical protein
LLCFLAGLLALFSPCSRRLVDHLFDNRIAAEHPHGLDPFVRLRFILYLSRPSDQYVHPFFESYDPVF